MIIIIFKVAFKNNIVSIVVGYLFAALRLSNSGSRNDSSLGSIEGAVSLLVTTLGPTHPEVAAMEVMRLRAGTLFVVMGAATLARGQSRNGTR